LQNELIFTSAALIALPGVILFVFATTSVLIVIGATIMALGAILGLVSYFTSRANIFGWIALILCLLTLTLGSGFIPVSLSFGLGLYTALGRLFAMSIVFLELGIATSSISGAYRKYSKDLDKAGYDAAESKQELGKFSKHMVLAASSVALLSFVIFFALEIMPQVQIDTISGLIIAIVIYFVIATYILRKPKTESAKADNYSDVIRR
jgi:hypothetical protein